MLWGTFAGVSPFGRGAEKPCTARHQSQCHQELCTEVPGLRQHGAGFAWHSRPPRDGACRHRGAAVADRCLRGA